MKQKADGPIPTPLPRYEEIPSLPLQEHHSSDKVLYVERVVKKLRAEQKSLSSPPEPWRADRIKGYTHQLFLLLYGHSQEVLKPHGSKPSPEMTEKEMKEEQSFPPGLQTWGEFGREILQQRKSPRPPSKIDRVVLGTLINQERPNQPWLVEDWWYKAAILQELKGRLPKEGQGQKPAQSEGARYLRRRASNCTSGTKRNHKQAALQLVEEIKNQTDWYWNNGRTAPQAKKEATRYVLDQWKKTSSAQDKPAIIAFVNDFLREH